MWVNDHYISLSEIQVAKQFCSRSDSYNVKRHRERLMFLWHTSASHFWAEGLWLFLLWTFHFSKLSTMEMPCFIIKGINKSSQQTLHTFGSGPEAAPALPVFFFWIIFSLRFTVETDCFLKKKKKKPASLAKFLLSSSKGLLEAGKWPQKSWNPSSRVSEQGSPADASQGWGPGWVRSAGFQAPAAALSRGLWCGDWKVESEHGGPGKTSYSVNRLTPSRKCLSLAWFPLSLFLSLSLPREKRFPYLDGHRQSC